jgi:hypothetical protein
MQRKYDAVVLVAHGYDSKRDFGGVFAVLTSRFPSKEAPLFAQERGSS